MTTTIDGALPPPPATTAETPRPPAGVDIIDLSPEDPTQLDVKWFRIGPDPDDVFCAAAKVPVQVGIDYVRAMRARDDDDDTAAEKFIDLLRRVLLPGHRERWEARYTSVTHPIDHRDIFRVSDRLLVDYGLRPPVPSGDSSDGSPNPDAGTSSEDAPPSDGSTSPPSPSTEASTSPTPSSSPD